MTWTAGQVVGASDLNAQIRDNSSYLAARPNYFSTFGSSTNYTLAGSATWAAIDSTAGHLTMTVTLQASARLWGFTNFLGFYNNTALNGVGYWGWNIDGATSIPTISWQHQRAQNGSPLPAYVPFQFTGLSAAAHTIVLGWWNDNTAGAAQTIYCAGFVPFWLMAWEF